MYFLLAIVLAIIVPITIILSIKMMIEIDKLNSLANSNKEFLDHHRHKRLMYIVLKKLDI
jgi:hypothetical protein